MNQTLAGKTGAALTWRAAQQAGVQGIYLVRTLVLARLLLPEHFGLVAIATTSVGLALNVSNLGMVPALVQREEAELTHYDTAWTVGVLRALLITGLIALAAPWIAAGFGAPEATNVVRALALRPLFEALASIQIARLTRDLQFRSLAAIRVPPALIDLIIAAVLARSLGVWAMVVGTLSGALTVIILSYLVAPHRPKLRIDRRAAEALIRFGRWIFVRGLLAVAGGALIQLVISRNMGVAALGLYALAGKLAFLPYQVASEVIGSVAFPLYSRLQANREEVAKAFRGFLVGITCLLLPAYALIFSLAPALVEHVLGPRWEGSAPIIQILVVVGALGLFGDTIDPLLKGLGHPKKTVVIGVVQTILIVAFVHTLADRFGAIGAAAAWIPAIGASQIISGIYLFQLVPKPFLNLGRPLLVVLLASVIAGAAASGLARWFPGAMESILTGVGSGLLAFWLIWWLDRRLALGLAEGIQRIFPRFAAWLQ